MAKTATVLGFMIFSFFVCNGKVLGASTSRPGSEGADTGDRPQENPEAREQPREQEEGERREETKEPDEDLPPGKTLPDTGYWNYLLIFGLRGRFLHYLLTNTNGFGKEIKELDHVLKTVIGEDKYVNLEKEVAESFELSKSLIRLNEIKNRIKDVQDPITKKTLGDAFRIIDNLSSNRKVVSEFVKRLNMVDNLADIFKNPEDPEQQFQEIKKVIQQDPKILSKLLADPTTVSNIFETLLRDITSDHFTKGAHTIKRMAHLLVRLFPDLERTWKELLQIQDPETGVSLRDDMKSLRNIMKTAEFKTKVESLLKHHHLRKITRDQNRVMPLLLQHGGISDESSHSKTQHKKLIDEQTPETCQQHLNDFGVTVSLKEATEILKDARDGTLFKEFNERIDEAETMDGGLIPENIAAAFQKKKIGVSPERVVQVMELITMLPPSLIALQLKKIGVHVTDADIVELQQKAVQATTLPQTRQMAQELGIDVAEEEEPKDVTPPQPLSQPEQAGQSSGQPTALQPEELPVQQIEKGDDEKD